MVHTGLEDHLEEVCPSCGVEHNAKWGVLFDNHPADEAHYRAYLTLDCANCGYKLMKKAEFMTSGHIDI